jgi:hypothetical protein
MEAGLLVLHRIIEACDPTLLPVQGDTDEQLAFKHRRVQNLIYLVQAVTGIDLGYRFEWRPRGTEEALRKAFDEKLLKRLQAVTSEIKNLEAILGARLSHGLDKPLAGRDRRMTEGAVMNLGEAAWRIEGAFARINSLYEKKGAEE